MWVYIEHDGKTVASVSLELCCELRKLCDVSKDKLMAVIIGDLPKSEIIKVKSCGIDGIIKVNGTGYEQFSVDAYANVFTQLSLKYLPSAIFVGGTINGRDFAPRFSVQLNTGCTSDAMELVYNEQSGDIEFIEPAVGGKIMAVITIPILRPQVGTIRPGTFKYTPCAEKESIDVINETINFNPDDIHSRRLDFTLNKIDPELDITDTDIIVCVGNGLKDADSLDRYRQLASLLGGKLACTRPLCDREILPCKLQIGQSGTMVKPRLYIAFGVSGAVNHIAGVCSNAIVAVNRDPNAQVFNYCDYGIVGDMDEVCDEFIEQMRSKA